MILGHSPLQVVIAAIPAVAWIAFAVWAWRVKIVQRWVIGWLVTFAVTICAGVALLAISD